jgi:acyl transferase domain-containing protein
MSAATENGALRRAMETIRDLRGRLEAGRASRRTAVVGVGVRAAGGIVDRHTYWSALERGRTLVGELPEERRRLFGAEWDGLPTRAGWLDDVLGFDARFFGISPREARSMDPQHRLLLEVTWEAFEDAAIKPTAVAATAGVYVGITGQDYRNWSTGVPGANWTTGNGHCFAAGRIAYTLGLQGPALAIDTACSSGLVAVHTACRALAAGDCDVAVAGGVNLVLSPRSTLEISRTDAFSANGRCRPFDSRANGFVRGEGCAMLLLKRLDDAVRDGDRVLAVVEGSGLNQDGRSSGFTAPALESQSMLITRVLAEAGLQPFDVGYLEAHGTGTPLGDPIELEAVAASIGKPAEGRTLHVGSVKSMIGHTESAAGALGLVKAVLCVRHRRIPPQASFDTLNPRIDITGTGIRIPTASTPWPGDAGRYAAVSSFGMSGTNAHAVVSAGPAPARRSGTATGFLVSADSPAALQALARAYADRLTTVDPDDYPAFTHTATAGRTRRREAAWIEADGPGPAAEALRALEKGTEHPRVRTPAAGEVVEHSGERAVLTLPTYPWQRVQHSIRRLTPA